MYVCVLAVFLIVQCADCHAGVMCFLVHFDGFFMIFDDFERFCLSFTRLRPHKEALSKGQKMYLGRVTLGGNVPGGVDLLEMYLN